MSSTDIITLIVVIVGVVAFAAVVTVLFKNYSSASVKEIALGQRDIEIIDNYIYNSDENVQKKEKVVNTTKTIAYYVFLGILIPLFGISLYSRIKNNAIKFGDQYVMVVASGSMSQKNTVNDYLIENNLNNQFNTYDVITLKTVAQKEIKKFDVIAYKNDQGLIIIHRIIEVQRINGEVRYTTRGDSNSGTDTYKPRYADIIGRYTNKRIPGIGVFILFFQSYAGIVVIVSVVYCTLIISSFNKKIEEELEKREELLLKTVDISSLDSEKLETAYVRPFSAIYVDGKTYIVDDSGKQQVREMNEDDKAYIDKQKELEELEEKQGSKVKQFFNKVFKKEQKEESTDQNNEKQGD